VYGRLSSHAVSGLTAYGIARLDEVSETVLFELARQVFHEGDSIADIDHATDSARREWLGAECIEDLALTRVEREVRWHDAIDEPAELRRDLR
jgi:hypothetical protein